MSIIQTERMILQPFDERDFDDFSGLRRDVRVMQMMVEGVMSGPATRNTFDAYLHAWQMHGLGMWAIRDLENRDYIGECGFWDREGEVGLSVRYLLHKKYWGRGLATEAVSAVVNFGLMTAGLKTLSAVALKDNIQSCRILERLGMQVIDENHQGIDGFRHYILPLNH